MNRAWIGCLLALALIVSTVQRVDAAYCGVASYKHGSAKLTTVGFAGARKQCSSCDSPSEPSCAAPATRMVKEVVYEKREYTCYKTICSKVIEQKTIDCVRYETEKSVKEVQYKVCKPVWETRIRSVNYTVSKPVWETITKEIPYTVMKPVY